MKYKTRGYNRLLVGELYDFNKDIEELLERIRRESEASS